MGVFLMKTEFEKLRKLSEELRRAQPTHLLRQPKQPRAMTALVSAAFAVGLVTGWIVGRQ